VSLKHIERLLTVTASPVGALWWCSSAAWAGIPLSSRQLGNTQQLACVLQSTPTIHEHESRHRSEPDRSHPDSQSKERDDAHQTEGRGHHEATGAAQHKPEQGPEYLTTIQGVDREDIEREQGGVDPHDRPDQLV
jgi:hypothetical protein